MCFVLSLFLLLLLTAVSTVYHKLMPLSSCQWKAKQFSLERCEEKKSSLFELIKICTQLKFILITVCVYHSQKLTAQPPCWCWVERNHSIQFLSSLADWLWHWHWNRQTDCSHCVSRISECELFLPWGKVLIITQFFFCSLPAHPALRTFY